MSEGILWMMRPVILSRRAVIAGAVSAAALIPAALTLRGTGPTMLSAHENRDLFLAPDQPLQISRKSPAIRLGIDTIYPFAEFSLEALVLSRKDYSRDVASRLSPVDLALAWGLLSNPIWREYLTVRQSRRFYHFRYPNGAPFTLKEAIRSTSNMHMAPENEAVVHNLKQVRAGNLVRIEGRLIDVRGDDGFTWNSSRTRNDTGDGACEIVLVSSLMT